MTSLERMKRLGRKAPPIFSALVLFCVIWDWVNGDFPDPLAWAIGFGTPLAIILILPVMEALKKDGR